MRTIETISRELLETGLNQQQTILLNEMIISMITPTKSRHAIAQSKYLKNKKKEPTKKSNKDDHINDHNPFAEPLILVTEELRIPVKEAKVRKTKKTRGTKLAPDFHPKEAHYELGAKFGFGRPWIDVLCQRMHKWALKNDHRSITTKSNWDLAFSEWIEREGEANVYRINGNSQNTTTGRATARETGIATSMARGAIKQLATSLSARPEDGHLPRNLDASHGDDFKRAS